METLAFLFTDMEGSTSLLERVGGHVYASVLAEHHQLIRAAIAAHGGEEINSAGDGFFAVFSSLSVCVEAVIEMQRALAAHPWPAGEQVRVRMGVHHGEGSRTSEGVVGLDVHRAARLAAVAYGGQVLLSESAAALAADSLPAGVGLRDLGAHRLKDLGGAQRLFQLEAEGLSTDFPSLRSLDNPQLANNLPVRLAPLIGRDTELAELRGLVEGTRLVTLTGAGGAGKTRLALQLAAEFVDGSGDGVWLVELAAVADPDLVAATVAGVLGIRPVPGRAMSEVLVDALADQNLLLVLDNCEHLIEACAELADALLRACPGVHVLASSRERLGVEGERVYRVPSLALAPAGVSDPGDLLGYGAIRLFVEQAAVQRPGFVLDRSTAPDVVALCGELDGMPLAIELATARLRSMSLTQVRARLGERFRLLVGSTRTAPQRQQTLRATVDWSYELLSSRERWALTAVSVFAGGFELDAAEAVCAERLPDWESADVLASLVDKSLLHTDAAGDVVRFSMLETIRQYGAERLAEDGNDAVRALRARHARYFLEFAEQGAGWLRGHEQEAWGARLESERANLRAAFAYLLDDQDGGSDALRLGIALQPLWLRQGGMDEGVRLLITALARADVQARDALRARALCAAGWLMESTADPRATVVLEEGLSIAREIGDERLVADTLQLLAWHRINRTDLEAAEAYAAETMEIGQRLGDQLLLADGLAARARCGRSRGDAAAAQADAVKALALYRQAGDRANIANQLGSLAYIEMQARNVPAARAYLQEAHEIAVELHDATNVLPFILGNLGFAAILDGDFAAAADYLHASLIRARRSGMPKEAPYALLGLALCASAEGEYELAAKLHGASSALFEALDHAIDTIEAGLLEHDLAALQAALGATFAPAYAAGRKLDVEAAIILAQSIPLTTNGGRHDNHR